MIKSFAVAAIAAAAVAAPAAAKEQCFDFETLSYGVCDAAERVDFSGPYFGGHLGVAGGSFEGMFDVSDGIESPVLGESASSGAIGLQIGYRHQYDSGVVVGVELDASFVDLGAEATDDPIAGDPEKIEGSVNLLASARLRLGYAFGRFLPYATAGVGLVSYEYRFKDQSTHVTDPGRADVVTRDETAVAAVFGGGVEYRVDDDITLRLEGLYYAVDEEIGLTSQLIDDADNGDFGGIEDVWTVRVGVSFEF